MKGFVFGKYLPFHLGHKALIDFAKSHCDTLYIVACCSNKENVSSTIRSSWIREIYPENNIKIVELNYDEAELPNTSESSVSVSELWAKKFKEVLPPVDLLVTSEPYGDYVAEFMDITHIPFDTKRIKVPVSSTQIRASVTDNWHLLPDPVKRFYQKKIVFLGTESTGKSSLSLELSKRLNYTWVEEVGRKIIKDSNHFSQKHLKQIAREHARHISMASQELKPIVLIDTDVHVTQAYSKFKFSEYFDLSDDIYEANKADLYLYLNKDFPYVQDGTRLDEDQRNQLDTIQRATLQDFGINYITISGSWQERLDLIKKLIEERLQVWHQI